MAAAFGQSSFAINGHNNRNTARVRNCDRRYDVDVLQEFSIDSCSDLLNPVSQDLSNTSIWPAKRPVIDITNQANNDAAKKPKTRRGRPPGRKNNSRPPPVNNPLNPYNPRLHPPSTLLPPRRRSERSASRPPLGSQLLPQEDDSKYKFVDERPLRPHHAFVEDGPAEEEDQQ